MKAIETLTEDDNLFEKVVLELAVEICHFNKELLVPDCVDPFDCYTILDVIVTGTSKGLCNNLEKIIKHLGLNKNGGYRYNIIRESYRSYLAIVRLPLWETK